MKFEQIINPAEWISRINDKEVGRQWVSAGGIGIKESYVGLDMSPGYTLSYKNKDTHLHIIKDALSWWAKNPEERLKLAPPSNQIYRQLMNLGVTMGLTIETEFEPVPFAAEGDNV